MADYSLKTLLENTEAEVFFSFTEVEEFAPEHLTINSIEIDGDNLLSVLNEETILDIEVRCLESIRS